MPKKYSPSPLMLPLLVETIQRAQEKVNSLFEDIINTIAALSVDMAQQLTLVPLKMPSEAFAKKALKAERTTAKRKYTKRREKAPLKAKKFPKHWTKTAEGKRRMSEVMKAKYANGWKPRRNRKSVPEPEPTFRVVPEPPPVIVGEYEESEP